MDWLRSENLKEEKGVRKPRPHYSSSTGDSLLPYDLLNPAPDESMEPMNKKKSEKANDATLAEVFKEMAKPRVAASARKDESLSSQKRTATREERRSAVNCEPQAHRCSE